ncbi:glycosyltransferase [Bradyrhizobium sp. SYSU BS000235]|uniref:glycosyltransferase n=1 Tax=Bradyrhizobium sp. SYSU BS000235 TaxID=3411332 RepID=UPI003C72B7B0
MPIYVDHTHLGRHVTGLERITLELFSPASLAPLDIVPVEATGTGGMITTQTFGLPWRMAGSPSVLLCPGFPPSPLLRPFASRVLPYIHDVFLLSRRQDLNVRAKLYMAAPFKLAVQNYPRFFVNSADTKRKLLDYCRSDAEITLYRPPVRNVFDLEPGDRAGRKARSSSLRLVTLGTVEPRKNFVAAARIVSALREQGFIDTTLEIIGRRGWSDDWQTLEQCPGVVLHGYQSTERANQIIRDADVFICTSHEEGLGLPLLEAQYAGLPVVAPDDSIFREVLGDSGIFIDPTDPARAAAEICHAIGASDWRRSHIERGEHNLSRWNSLAAADRRTAIDLIGRLARSPTQMPQISAQTSQSSQASSGDRSAS